MTRIRIEPTNMETAAMDPLPTCTVPRSSRGVRRRGLSVIEVLTSMLVAIIGVAGVLVLIPFASRQAEQGLDIDDARRLARNAIEKMEIGSHDRLLTNNQPAWVFSNTLTQVPNGTIGYEVYAMDPLGATVATDSGGNLQTQFPFTNPDQSPGFPGISLVNFANWNGTTPIAYTAAEAQRVSRLRDDLVYLEPVDDLAGPVQELDVNGATPLRRQARERLSWSSIVVPLKDDYTSVPTVATGPWKWRQHFLAWRDRSVRGANGVYPVLPNWTLTRPVAGALLRSGGTIQIPAVDLDIRRGDWIMLSNVRPDPDPGSTIDDGFLRQIAFYEVIGVGEEPAATNITLNGPEFSIFDPTTTHALLLVEFDAKGERVGSVINVFERTLTPKQLSSWN